MGPKNLPLFLGVLVLLAGAGYLLSRTLTRENEPPTLSPPVRLSSGGDTQESSEMSETLRDGLQAVREGRLDEARGLLETVPEDDPGYLVARFNLGYLYENADEAESAIQAFRTVAELQGESADTFTGLGRAYLTAQRYERAEWAAMRAVELDQRHVPARYLLGLVRVARGDVVNGTNAYRRALKLDAEGRQIGQAIHELQRLEEARPEHPGTHYALALLASLMQQRETERRHLRRYLELGPDGPTVDAARSRLEILGESDATDGGVAEHP